MLGDNAVSDNGILESITCINFMCHERLHCELGPLLNFIVGENGSGKSAILTAITLCLGGKASSTNRGGSLKSFVKEGRDRAILTVKIKNQGVDGYKQDVYGDSIIVERHFSRVGASGFKVKSATGQIISTKKQEVDEVSEYYCLQVDNPLNVLSQDNARQFLNAASASQKYKFFIEGVQLEQLDRDYRLVSEYLESSEEKVPLQEERVGLAKKDWERAKRLSEMIQNHQQARRRFRLLTSQLAWSQVSDEEKRLAERDQAILDVEARTTDTERAIEERAQLLEEEDEKIRRAEADVLQVKEDEGRCQAQVDAAEEEFRAAKKTLEQLHTDERGAYSELTAADNKRKDLEQKIKVEQKRLEDSNGDALTLKREDLAKAKDNEEAIHREIADNKSLLPELETNLNNAKRGVGDIVGSIERKRDEILKVESKIQQLQRGQGSQYDAYHPRLPDLLKMIAAESGFQNKPIGPLGAHIQLLNPIWSSILETTLGGNLNAFIVTSRHDHQILQRLVNRSGVRSCPILIGNQQPLRTDGNEPDPSFDTILRVLKFDNQLVRDQLIINNGIEQVILVADRVKSEDVMFSGPAPRNVMACLSLHDGKRGEGLRLTNRNGNYSTTPVVPNPNSRPRMKTDSGSQLEILKDTLQQLGDELRELESHKRRAQQDANRFEKEISQHAKQKKTLEHSLRKAQAAIENIEIELDKFDGIDGRLQGFQEQLEQVEKDKHHHGVQYGDLKAKKENQNVEAEARRKKLKAAKTELKDYDTRVEKATNKVNRLNQVRSIILAEKNEAHAELDMLKDDKRRAEEKRLRQADQLADFIRMAQQVSPQRVHIAENESYQSVEKAHLALKAQLEAAQKERGMTDAEVYDLVINTKAAYDQVRRDLKTIKDVNQTLKNTLTKRLHKWRTFQRYISAHSRANFIYLLSERGFRGKLMLDHEHKRLAVQVEPDKTEKKAAGRNTKTLSGGEKSFSSICLLLSIWEAMGSPLRCLDEFDVFMDNVNRAISTNMLVSCSKHPSCARGVWFLTFL
jgi:chromosome segregation ATPase